ACGVFGAGGNCVGACAPACTGGNGGSPPAPSWLQAPSSAIDAAAIIQTFIQSSSFVPMERVSSAVRVGARLCLTSRFRSDRLLRRPAQHRGDVALFVRVTWIAHLGFASLLGHTRVDVGPIGLGL